MLTRREFSKYLVAGGAAALAPGNLGAAGRTPVPDEGSTQDCDLLIKGGTVIDPGQHLHAQMDVAVKAGKILEVSRNFPESRARRVVSAKDKIVTPGFIDLHVHGFPGAAHGMIADRYCLGRGVTTAVDGGTTGSFMIERFIKDIVNTSITRVYAWVHIGTMGALIGTKYLYQDLDWADPLTTAKAAMDNRPTTVGIKVHLLKGDSTHPQDLEPEVLKRAVQAAEASRLPLMVHATNQYYPLPDILKMMRKGDVYTHCFNDYPHNILDANGKLLPEAREARQRGVLFDIGIGPHTMSMDVAEKCLQQGFPPDTLSTDLHYYIETNAVDDLPTLMSRFLALGMDLDKVVEMVTANPSKVCDFGLKLGTLQPGSVADISVAELREGKFEFPDHSAAAKEGSRMGRKMLVNQYVVCRGQLFANAA
jgi:dihydroorotase